MTKQTSRNYLKEIYEKLDVDTLEEAVEIINKDPEKNITLAELQVLQKKIDELYETILANQNAFGVQNIYVPRGADVIKTQLLGRKLSVIEVNPPSELTYILEPNDNKEE